MDISNNDKSWHCIHTSQLTEVFYSYQRPIVNQKVLVYVYHSVEKSPQ